MMKRFLIIFLLAFFLMASPTLAITYSGGTDQQRAFAQEVIESCWFDWSFIDACLSEVNVVFEDCHEPYWDSGPSEGAAGGLAWYGEIRINEAYQPEYDSYLGEVIAHEWSHQIWFSMSKEWKNKYVDLCGKGDESNWWKHPAENFAECMRVALFDPLYYATDYPRTTLVAITPEACREFVMEWRWSHFCHFIDLKHEDDELRAASAYLNHEGIILGYLDRSVSAYQPLLRRHVALICERMELECALSVDDYAPALRADVRDSISGLSWLEERWTEPITRGQLMRLMWRAQVF